MGIGKAGKDNGVLLVIAPNERKTQIETGKGVGGQLTDLQKGIPSSRRRSAPKSRRVIQGKRIAD